MGRKTTRAVSALLGLLAALLLAGCSERDAIRINWGLKLPSGGELVYEANSGSSFHGDGIRYHVFRYQEGARLAEFLPWEEPSVNRAEKAEGFLDEIQVPVEERADFAVCLCWYDRQEDNSELYVFYDEETGTLYVVESFL